MCSGLRLEADGQDVLERRGARDDPRTAAARALHVLQLRLQVHGRRRQDRGAREGVLGMIPYSVGYVYGNKNVKCINLERCREETLSLRNGHLPIANRLVRI